MPVNIFKMFLWGAYQLQNVWNIRITFFFSLHSKHTATFDRADQTLSVHKNGESIHDKGLRMYFFACSLNEKTHEACTVSILKSSIQFLILLWRRNKVSNYTCISRIQLNRSTWNSPVKEDTLVAWLPNFARACNFLILELLDEIWAYSIAV